MTESLSAEIHAIIYFKVTYTQKCITYMKSPLTVFLWVFLYIGFPPAPNDHHIPLFQWQQNLNVQNQNCRSMRSLFQIHKTLILQRWNWKEMLLLSCIKNPNKTRIPLSVKISDITVTNFIIPVVFLYT